ncbi:hypothetical protein COO60DRAFT_1060278 [Scenedesmus sp. NREL 46B-D3]|nr:hypothetical protein COO60DRAFT_1060278 [Scenedesmus sp. NREL 46B-D3]
MPHKTCIVSECGSTCVARCFKPSSPAIYFAGSDCFLLESIFEAEVWAYMCQPVSPQNEAAVCSAMMDGAREALARYGSTIDEDLALLRNGGVVAGSRQCMAVQVRGSCAMVGGMACKEVPNAPIQQPTLRRLLYNSHKAAQGCAGTSIQPPCRRKPMHVRLD